VKLANLRNKELAQRHQLETLLRATRRGEGTDQSLTTALAQASLELAGTLAEIRDFETLKRGYDLAETYASRRSGIETVGVDDRARMTVAPFGRGGGGATASTRSAATIPNLRETYILYPTAAYRFALNSAVATINGAAGDGLLRDGSLVPVTADTLSELPDENEVYVAFVELIACIYSQSRTRGYDGRYVSTRVKRDEADRNILVDRFSRLQWNQSRGAPELEFRRKQPRPIPFY